MWSEMLIRLQLRRVFDLVDKFDHFPAFKLKQLKDYFTSNASKIASDFFDIEDQTTMIQYLSEPQNVFTGVETQSAFLLNFPKKFWQKYADPAQRGLIFYSSSSNLDEQDLPLNDIEVLESTDVFLTDEFAQSNLISQSVVQFYKKLVSKKNLYVHEYSRHCTDLKEILQQSGLEDKLEIFTVSNTNRSIQSKNAHAIIDDIFYAVSSLESILKKSATFSESMWNCLCLSRLIDTFLINEMDHRRELPLRYKIFVFEPHRVRDYRPVRDATSSPVVRSIKENFICLIGLESKKSARSASNAFNSDIAKLGVLAKANLHVASHILTTPTRPDLCFLSLYHEGENVKAFISYYAGEKVRIHCIASFDICAINGQVGLICLLLNANDYYAKMKWEPKTSALQIFNQLSKNTSTHQSKPGSSAATPKHSGSVTPPIAAKRNALMDNDICELTSLGYRCQMTTVDSSKHYNICQGIDGNGKPIICKKTTRCKELEFLKLFNSLEHRQKPVNLAVQLQDAIYCQNQYYLLVFPKYQAFVDQQGCQLKRPKHVIERVIQQLQQFVQYMHSLDISHRDIKPKNLALDANDNLVVLDFGLSMKGNVETDDSAGTEAYLPPDFVHGEKNYWTFDLDKFALQLTIEELRETFVDTYTNTSTIQNQPADT